MTTDYKQYLLSPEWKEFRKKVFQKYGRKCSQCPATKSLHIHHLHYGNIFHEELEDVIVLCKKHHDKIHGRTPKKKPVKKKKKKTTMKEWVIYWRRYEKNREKKRKKTNKRIY